MSREEKQKILFIYRPEVAFNYATDPRNRNPFSIDTIVAISNKRQESITDVLSEQYEVTVLEEFPINEDDLQSIVNKSYDIVITHISKNKEVQPTSDEMDSVDWSEHYSVSMEILQKLKQKSVGTRVIAYTGASIPAWEYILSQNILDGIIQKTEDFERDTVELMKALNENTKFYVNLEVDTPYYEFSLRMRNKKNQEVVEKKVKSFSEANAVFKIVDELGRDNIHKYSIESLKKCTI
jgi:DNA-binding NarL/FixJ family response regulator